MFKYLLFIILLSFSACSSTNSKEQNKDQTQYPIYKQLTKKYKNIQGQFHPDGQKIIFVSSNRERHKNSQIYELNLKSGEERRITHQDGEVKDPTYSSDGHTIYYSSTTDEIKEDPLYLKQKLREIENKDIDISLLKDPFLSGSELLPYEIYQSDVSGENIKRLTQKKYLDHEADLHPFKNIMVFSSVRNQGLELFLKNLNNDRVTQFTKDKFFKGEAKFSNSGDHLAWIAYSPVKKTSQIFIQNMNTGKKSQITFDISYHWFPEWSPDDKWIYFSANISDPKNFDIYRISRSGKCLKRLTSHPSFEAYPSINKAGDKLIFTSERSGSSQIHIMDLKAQEACAD